MDDNKSGDELEYDDQWSISSTSDLEGRPGWTEFADQGLGEELVTEPETDLPIPFEIVPADIHLSEIGTIRQLVANSHMIINPKPETAIRDIGCLVSTGDRRVLGFISDVFGQVSSPKYSVVLNERNRRILEDGISTVFSVSGLDPVVDLQALREIQGTDASSAEDCEADSEPESDILPTIPSALSPPPTIADILNSRKRSQ